MDQDFIRVIIIDDHLMLREGLKILLESEPDIQVIGEGNSGEEAIDLARRLNPDVMVMDLGLPGISGLEAIRQVHEEQPEIRFVVLSMHSGKDMVMQAIEAGSHGYVPKSAAHKSLLEAIRVVHNGQRFLDPSAATAVVESMIEKNQETKMLEVLSNRETEVLRWIAMGFTSREIGEKLALSPKTVDTYRQRAMEKLGLTHRSDLIRFALNAGLLKESL